ncbi:unnamed protein product [Nezara viridula]|uniref:SCP2 domain-containing protein n=1 Tax=Nezara viridula TaxID=85310 RepID=A0A9P0H9S3_NEZVI|nr:unnamed protein product [Nezara viridula]
MMNTRKLTEKTFKAVKDINAAISHHHSKLQGNLHKETKQVEATSHVLRSSSSGMAATKQYDFSENRTSGTVFLSNEHFNLPLHTSKYRVSCTLASYSSSTGVVPAPSEFIGGIATSALGPKYDKNLMKQQSRMMSTRAVNANRGTIEGIITNLNEKFNADIVNDTQAIYQFNILSGDRREIYYIDLRNGSGSAGKGKSEGNPDTIFSIDAENFNRLVEGNLRAPTAFMTGRMKISGSMQKAAKLEKLFVTLLNN